MEERVFHVLMHEVCSEMGIKVETLSYGWILQLSKNGKIRHITGTRFDLNPEATGDIACDKYGTYEVLKSQNVPVIEHVMIFNPATRLSLIEEEGIWYKITTELKKWKSIVIKPNYGCEGKGVFLCHNIKEAETAIHKLFKTENSVSVCPYYDIKTEYRTFYLDGEVKLIYGKTKPAVIGNGKFSMKKLIEELNLPDKSIVKDNLRELELSYIPGLNEKVDISWKHNLSGGAIPKILEKGDLYQKIEDIAITAGKAMNINFATIDIIETNDNMLYVLEVNSGICTTIFTNLVENGSKIIKDIYREAITKLFD